MNSHYPSVHYPLFAQCSAQHASEARNVSYKDPGYVFAAIILIDVTE